MLAALPAGLLLLPLLGGCQRSDPALVLYLREAEPAATTFPRVTPGQYDIGTLSRLPPTQCELRHCGDVVAFALPPEVAAEGPAKVDEVVIRLLWWTPHGRARLALWSASQQKVVAETALAGCTAGQGEPECHKGWTNSVVRLPLAPVLQREQLANLHVVLDAAGAQVEVVSCPELQSLVVLQPPDAAAMARDDSDGDGVFDQDELLAGTAPWFSHGDRRLEPEQRLPVAPLPAPPPVPDDGWLAPIAAGQRRVVEGGVVGVRGRLAVQGQLELRNTTLVVHPGADGQVGLLELGSAGSLSASDSTITAGDRGDGWGLSSTATSSLELKRTKLHHIGVVRQLDDGLVALEALAVQMPGAVLEDLVVQGSSPALDLLADGLTVRGARSQDNGTVTVVAGSSATITGLDSVDDSMIALVLEGGSVQVRDSTERRAREAVVWLQDGASAELVGNDLHSEGRIVTPTDGRHHIVDNTLRSCPQLPRRTSDFPGNRVEAGSAATCVQTAVHDRSQKGPEPGADPRRRSPSAHPWAARSSPGSVP